MDDLISRQAAINAIENTDCELPPYTWDELTDAIMKVPSVQPKQLLERTRKAIFEKYPNAVVDFEYDWGEIIFYPDAEKSDSDENIHSGYIRNGILVDVTDF